MASTNNISYYYSLVLPDSYYLLPAEDSSSNHNWYSYEPIPKQTSPECKTTANREVTEKQVGVWTMSNGISSVFCSLS